MESKNYVQKLLYFEQVQKLRKKIIFWLRAKFIFKKSLDHGQVLTLCKKINKTNINTLNFRETQKFCKKKSVSTLLIYIWGANFQNELKVLRHKCAILMDSSNIDYSAPLSKMWTIKFISYSMFYAVKTRKRKIKCFQTELKVNVLPIVW